jgi:hypothetical protein
VFKSDELPKAVDFIALLSFASTPNRLTNGSRETVNLTVRLADQYPNAFVIGGTYFDNSKPDVERSEKERILGERFIWVGPVTSTTDEYMAIVKEAQKRNLGTDRIIVVDESYHSIRARIVWNYYLPEARLSFQLISGSDAADRENPMPLQRNSATWLLVNLIFAPSYKWWPGVEWWARKNFNQSFKK